MTLPITRRGVVVVIVGAVVVLTTTTTIPTATAASESIWYTRYPVYPPYCSTPADMENRTIPPLAQDKRLGSSRIVQVTAIIRHGARTPYQGGMGCWKGYQENIETAVWDCNLTTFVSPPPPDRVQQEEGRGAATDAEGMFLFEKHYDALFTPAHYLSNHLNGTCQEGQLILRGYEQEVTNGRHLRDAYVYDSTGSGKHFLGLNKDKGGDTHDPRMRLWDVSGNTNQQFETQIYYRADDDQRTVMSGQLILRGMFGPEMDAYFAHYGHYPVIPLHTADRARDVLDPNHHICPRLEEMKERYEASRDFQLFNYSLEVVALRAFQRNSLGTTTVDGDMDGDLDCLMTTICTDRTLPDVLNDYTGGDEGSERDQVNNETNWFLRLANYYAKKGIAIFLANDSEYSKLSMGPLWAEIMDNINAVLEAKDEICCPSRTVPTLAIFSGHDTTLIPLLASLGVYDEKWPPYASEMVIEIHQLNLDGQTNKQLFTTDYGFRLIYNGQVLTNRISQCLEDGEICDVVHLVDLVSKFATRQPDCARQHPIPQVSADTITAATALLSTKGGIGATLIIILGSAAFGAVATFLYLTSSSSPRRVMLRRKYQTTLVDGDGIALSDLDGGNFESEGTGVYSDTVVEAETTLD